MSDVTVADGGEALPNPAIEAEAKDYGWTPKDDFKGPADKWRPADEYLQWAKSSGRVPRKEFDEIRRQFPAIRKENKELKDKLGEVETALKEFVEFSGKAEQRAYERARKEIEGRIEAAAANADQNAARAAMAELDKLEKPQPKSEPKKANGQDVPKVDPAIQDWLDNNQWYTKDRTLNSYATDIFGDLERNAPGMSTEERLAETKKRTMDKFPEKFGINPDRDRASAVAEPRTAGARRNAHSYENLPPEAKKACDKFVRTIPGYKREDYLRDYEWE